MKKIILLTIVCLFILSACQSVDLNMPVPVFDTGVDANSWAEIPAGEFLHGQFNEVVNIDYTYSMMVTPVTNEQYAAFLNAALADGSIKIVGEQVVGYYPGDAFNDGRHEEEIAAGDYVLIPLDNDALRLNFDGMSFTAKPDWSNHPMTMVSWFGAKAYCDYYDWRLPTELEWEKAARGFKDARAFPWGDSIARNNANFVYSRDPFEDMGWYGSLTTPVGFYNGKTYDGYTTLDSPSPYGLYDMAGNVWQWTADVYEAQHYRYMRGGSKEMYENSLRIWVRNNASPIFYNSSLGFRCVK